MPRRGAGLGLVIFDPMSGRILVSYLQTPEYFFDLFEPKAQYVGQLESLAQLAGTITAEYHIPRLDETARFLESRIESYNVHAHSTRLLRCSEVNKGWYSEVI